jgi:hypothetical protein
MSIYEVDIGWAGSENARRFVHWELLACEEILGVFASAREHTLVVLFDGDTHRFRDWVRSFAPEVAR